MIRVKYLLPCLRLSTISVCRFFIVSVLSLSPDARIGEQDVMKDHEIYG